MNGSPSVLNAGRNCSVLFFSRPRSEGWPHHKFTFSIYLCPLSFWLSLTRRVLTTSWCCPFRPCVVFFTCMHLALFLALSLSPGNSIVSSWCDHSMLASLLWQYLAVPSLLQLYFLCCPWNPQNLFQSFHLKGRNYPVILVNLPSTTATQCYWAQRTCCHWPVWNREA